MNESFHNVNKRWSLLLISVFVVLFIFWLLINYGSLNSYTNNQIWAATYQVIALLGGILGLYYSNLWGGHKSYIGRGILFLSIGLLLQCFGQSVYSYFIFYQHIDIPYPSLGDIGFFGSVLTYIGGATQIARASGVSLNSKYFKAKAGVIIFPVVLLLVSYFIFLKGYQFDFSNPTKIFLDFGYPFGQAFYVSIALITILFCRQLLGGIMKKPLMLLTLALILQYVSDFTFLYESNNGTWRAGGVNDLLYSVSYLLMSLALVYIGKTFLKIQES